jgi:sugar lactone lactonase YvrE
MRRSLSGRRPNEVGTSHRRLGRWRPVWIAGLALLGGGAAVAAERGASDLDAAVAQAAEEVRQQPDNAVLHFYLAYRLAAAGDSRGAIAALERASEKGDGLLPQAALHFPQLASNPAFQELMQRLSARIAPVTTADVNHVLLDRDFRPQGLAYDPRSQRTFVSSARTGRIVAIDAQGQETVFEVTDGVPVSRIAIDAETRELLVVRSNGLIERPAQAINRLEIYHLDQGVALVQFEVPKAQALHDVVTDGAGQYYLSDSLGGTIWHIHRVRSRVKPWIQSRDLRGASGLALDATRGVIFVAHGRGIARIHIEDVALIPQLPVHSREIVAAIDGLRLVGKDLVGIQNLTTPGRVIRMTLDARGHQILAVQPLLTHHHPMMTEPSTAVLVGDHLRILTRTGLSQSAATLPTRDPAALIDVPLTAPSTTQPATTVALSDARPASPPELRLPPGFRKRVHRGETMYCSKITILGSRFPKIFCVDEDGLRTLGDLRDSNQDSLRRAQSVCGSQLGCSGG